MSAGPSGSVRRARRAVLAFTLVATLGAGGIALAGSSDQRRTAFSLEVPSTGTAATLAPGHRLCQGPIVAPTAVAGVELWLGPVAAPGTTLRVQGISSAGSVLASGSLPARFAAPVTPSVGLDRTVPAATTFSVCLMNAGRAAVPLSGAPPQLGSGVLSAGDRSVGAAAAMVMLTPHPRSLLSSLPAAFRRAALFRPAWMGAWTFWLLLAGVVAAFPLAGVAVMLAARAEDQSLSEPPA